MHRVFAQAAFLTSAADARGLPPDTGREVAFAGRSNAGKSSALNAITARRQLARVSKTPGRTQLINFFSLGDAPSEALRLADLPGYGFAQVPLEVKQRWRGMIEGYLQARRSLRGLVLVMDVRHPLTDFDTQMLEWCGAIGLPVHVLLSKADKLSRSAAAKTLAQVRAKLGQRASAQLFSAENGAGVDEARDKVLEWLEGDTKKDPGESGGTIRGTCSGLGIPDGSPAQGGGTGN